MRHVVIAIVAAVIAGGVAASCTLFEGDIPDRTCRNDNDCFRAQGEHCDIATKECVLGPDAPPGIDSASSIDAAADAAVDAAIDATVTL